MQDLITAYADGELEPTRRDATERHVAGCAACAAILANLTAMKAAMRADALLFNAPGSLVKRIDSLIDKTAGPTGKSQPGKPKMIPKWLPPALAASVLLAAAIGAYIYFTPTARQRLDAEAAADHQRAVGANHLVDFATNDPKKLADWFASKGNSFLMIPNQIPKTMTLIGGRTTTLNGQCVAAIVFQEGSNTAVVFQWPHQQPAEDAASETVGNAHVTSWGDGNRSFIALSEGGPTPVFDAISLFTVDRCGTH
jgi:anti-sigma factor RsiW